MQRRLAEGRLCDDVTGRYASVEVVADLGGQLVEERLVEVDAVLVGDQRCDGERLSKRDFPVVEHGAAGFGRDLGQISRAPTGGGCCQFGVDEADEVDAEVGVSARVDAGVLAEVVDRDHDKVRHGRGGRPVTKVGRGRADPAAVHGQEPMSRSSIAVTLNTAIRRRSTGSPTSSENCSSRVAAPGRVSSRRRGLTLVLLTGSS